MQDFGGVTIQDHPDAEEEENIIVKTNESFMKNWWLPFKETLVNFLSLGFTNFGGTIGLIQKQFVEHKKWLSNAKLIELYGLAQSLPGANICKVIIGIGLLKNGFWNGIFALMLYCLPSFICLLIIGWLQDLQIQFTIPYWLNNAHIGLICSSIAFSILATWKLLVTVLKLTILQIIACIVCIITLLFKTTWLLPVSMVIGGLISLSYFTIKEENIDQEIQQESQVLEPVNNTYMIPIWLGIIFILVFIVLLILVYSIRAFVEWELLSLIEFFLRMGTLIIGGGQTGILLLRDEMVRKSWITDLQFINGFSLINALPGPKFNIAAYLGATMGGLKYGLLYGIISGVVFLLPGTLLYIGMLPIWEKINKNLIIKKIVLGFNAVVMGYVIATVINLWADHVKLFPLHITSTIFSLSLLIIFDLHAVLVIIFSMLYTLVVGLFIQLE